MRVFVTGASGFIGSAIVQELINAGHRVLGLARSDDAAGKLDRLGVEVQRGDLSNHDSLVAGARASDGVIHTAFVNDFADFAAAVDEDRRAVEALVAALSGSDRPLVIASGTLIVSHARPGTEQDTPQSTNVPRAASEAMVLEAAERGVRGSVVRLAPAVHDRTRAGLVSRMVVPARQNRISAYVGDGANRWPAVHRLDAARLFCLALERAHPGTRLHAVAEEGIPMRAIATAIGQELSMPVRSINAEEASAYFGPLAPFVSLDNPASSTFTRKVTGWHPKEVGLLADLRHGEYFVR
jgi:nucleoside-diphosphate-sugar epimerase